MIARWLRRLLAPLLKPIFQELVLQRNELRFLRSTLTQGFEIMSKELDDANAAVDALTAEVAKLVGQMKVAAGEIADLTAQIAGASPSGIETLATKINAQVALLQAAGDALVPPAAPAPQPAPAPVATAPAAPVAQVGPVPNPAPLAPVPQPVAQAADPVAPQPAQAVPQA